MAVPQEKSRVPGEQRLLSPQNWPGGCEPSEAAAGRVVGQQESCSPGTHQHNARSRSFPKVFKFTVTDRKLVCKVPLACVRVRVRVRERAFQGFPRLSAGVGVDDFCVFLLEEKMTLKKRVTEN